MDEYWARPLAAQGSPPAHLTDLETSLEPAACQTCHPQQFTDWEKSRHARAMGAGVYGQMLDMTAEEAQVCRECHAPLKEQVNTSLSQQGLICSACHLRQYQWFGPPSRKPHTVMHKDWQSHAAFEDSRFCVTCHQFSSDGYAINGKLLENTYEEWKNSPQAKKGITCQACHMPDRRHLWRGIHDIETVRSGVQIQTSPLLVTDGFVTIQLSLSNTGTGHYFPTYITPKVVMQVYQEDHKGVLLKNTLQETIIARHLSLDLTTEYFDTRLAPGDTAFLKYHAPILPNTTLIVRILVMPDAFYTRLYQNLLDHAFTDKGHTLIQQALIESVDSMFTLYQKRYKVLSESEFTG
ncbi:MAG: hypothetical protein KAH77_08455 [Thiomargarita sp.]|nr:hypothetical protein [Thiomargarita sp.]